MSNIVHDPWTCTGSPRDVHPEYVNEMGTRCTVCGKASPTPIVPDDAACGRIQELVMMGSSVFGNNLADVGEVGKPPSHYAGNSMQPFDVIDTFNLDFYEGSAVKYLLRWRKKGGITDLKKARHYIDELIVRAERGE